MAAHGDGVARDFWIILCREKSEVLEPDGGGTHAAVDEEEGWLLGRGRGGRGGVKDFEVAVGSRDEGAGDSWGESG